MVEIESFNFEIQHRPGIIHTNADGTSRAPHIRAPTLEEKEASEEFIHAVISTGLYEHHRDGFRQEVFPTSYGSGPEAPASKAPR